MCSIHKLKGDLVKKMNLRKFKIWKWDAGADLINLGRVLVKPKVYICILLAVILIGVLSFIGHKQYVQWKIEETGKEMMPILKSIIERTEEYVVLNEITDMTELHFYSCSDNDIIIALDNYEDQEDVYCIDYGSGIEVVENGIKYQVCWDDDDTYFIDIICVRDDQHRKYGHYGTVYGVRVRIYSSEINKKSDIYCGRIRINQKDGDGW